MVKFDPYPLDEFPDKEDAENLFRPFGFNIHNFICMLISIKFQALIK